VFLLFLLWEWRARTKLVDLAGGRKLAFFTPSRPASSPEPRSCHLVDIQLVAQTLLGRDAAAVPCCWPGSWPPCRSGRSWVVCSRRASACAGSPRPVS